MGRVNWVGRDCGICQGCFDSLDEGLGILMVGVSDGILNMKVLFSILMLIIQY
jgi:hypothetical protein